MHTLRKARPGAFFVFVLAAQIAPADAKWKTIDPPGAHLTSPAGISNGVVTGYYWASNDQNDVHGFVRTPEGSLTIFDAGSGHTIPTAINNKGVVAGWYGNYPGQGFVRAADGTITTFDVPGASSTTVLSINDKGMVVGYYSGSYGFLRTASGKIKTIKVSSAVMTLASAVNDNSVIAGEYLDQSGIGHGFVRAADGKVTKFDIPGVTNPFDVYPASINSSGTIAGWYMASDYTFHGFLRDSAGNVTILDIGKTATTVFGINASGNIVGSYDFSHGYVRTPDGQVTTLDYPRANHTLPVSIDEKGRITGQYYSDADGFFHGFLLKR